MAAVPEHGRAQPSFRLLGRLLVQRGALTEEQLEAALAEQERTQRPLGTVVVDLGFVTPALVAQALATQHGGLLKTEYGYATGFEAEAPADVGGAEGTAGEARVMHETGRHDVQLRLETASPAPVVTNVPDAAADEPAATEAESHFVLFSTGGAYRLLERPGPAPAVGTVLGLAEWGGTVRPHRVVRVGRAPLPDSAARCAYLLADS
jgi:hypothetical protein